jgi:hypothetical protein
MISFFLYFIIVPILDFFFFLIIINGFKIMYLIVLDC